MKLKEKRALKEKIHPYSSFLHLVEKPARYVGGEYRAVIKEEADIRMCLAFPDVYDIGMSHLGTKILYGVLNNIEGVALERAYTPWVDMEQQLRDRGLPLLSLETARPLSEFDVVGFSLQYEMTYTNILTMLDLGGIPLRSEHRTMSDPIVVAGGPCATHPEVLAPFIDAFLIGDAEAQLPVMLETILAGENAGKTRAEQLFDLAQLQGVYVPSLYDAYIDERSGLMVVGAPLHPGLPEKIERAFVEDINRFPFPSDSPEPVAEAIFDRVSVEIARGCTEGCRFCQAGMIYRPVRERDPDQIIDTLLSSIETGGYDEASLTSLSTADYSCVSPLVKKLMERLKPKKVSLSVSSLRAYGLEESLLDDMASVRATGLTFAPEAGTQRMRDVVNKNICEEDIFTTCHRVFSRGWNRVKLYFMVGLPTEEDEDVVGIAEMGRQAREIGRGYNRSIDVTVSVSSHVPKPHTPFQWCAMDSMDEIQRKQQILTDYSRQYRYKFRKHNPRISHLEGIVTRGDRRGADLIEFAWREGARFDGWDEHLDWEAWQRALEQWEERWDLDRSIFLSTLPVDGRLPWDHIDVSLEDGFLLKEYKKAVAGRLSPPCGKPYGAKVHHSNLEEADEDERRLVCYHCGVACDLGQMRTERKEFLTQLNALAPRLPEETPTERERAQERYRKGDTPRKFDRGDNQAYRIRYTKRGQVSLQGHLDLVRMIPRIYRRAGLDLVYTEGFHPKPLMQFSPALALGIKSVSECADLRLVKRVSPDEMLQRLNGVAPEGLRFLAVEELKPEALKLSKAMNVQDFWFTAPSTIHSREREAVETELEKIVSRFMSKESEIVTRARKGKDVPVDVRAGITAMDWAYYPEFAESMELSSPYGVWVRLPFSSGTLTPRPIEICHAVFGDEIPFADVVRIGLWHQNEDEELIPLIQKTQKLGAGEEPRYFLEPMVCR